MLRAEEAANNRLLRGLPAQDLARWLPYLERMELPAGKALQKSGEAVRYAYFPCTAVVSIQYSLENGSTAEIALVGQEGMVGIALLLGGGSMTGNAVVQSAGQAFRIQADDFRRDAPSPAAMLLLLRYLQALWAQMAQTAICNKYHVLEQQLCRWMLLSLDRLPGNSLDLTQESIAGMLGVRRECITEAAAKLQRAGVIRYTRGHIEILDRPGLEQRSCECYVAIQREYDRLLPHR